MNGKALLYESGVLLTGKRLSGGDSAKTAQDVWAVKVFDRIENPWMTDEIGEPSKQEVRLVPQVAAERPACLTLEAFKAAAIAECLGVRHYADRRDKTLVTELIDLRLCQDFGHRHRDSGAKYI